MKKARMTMQELQNMQRMAMTISFAKRLERPSQAEYEKELLAGINEWLRGDDEATRKICASTK